MTSASQKNKEQGVMNGKGSVKGSGHKVEEKGMAATLSAKLKKQMEEELCCEFPQCSKSVVSMALETCEYDKSKTREILKSFTTTTTTTAASHTTLITTTTTTTAAAAAVAAGTVPSYQTSQQNGLASLDNNTPQLTVTYDSGEQTVGRVTDRSVERPTTSAHSEVDKSRSVVNTGTLAKGPNVSLAHGPNKALLKSDYVRESGSNADYHHGACKDNQHGPNPQLHQGSQQGLAQGPQGLAGCSSPLHSPASEQSVSIAV